MCWPVDDRLYTLCHVVIQLSVDCIHDAVYRPSGIYIYKYIYIRIKLRLL